ncbi:unnamed protein product, partial [Cyprideis torosa]
MARRLRSGYTTGACAAAAAKAAALLALRGERPDSVELIFPDGSRHRFAVHRLQGEPGWASASIIKDAGDDPDVTNRAEICATVELNTAPPQPGDVRYENIILAAGKGVGTVTKAGLAVPVGEPAINPVPRKMICAAVVELAGNKALRVTISIPAGKKLAERTLNHRLGIVGGLSILGTTGIVQPVSADAWKATIKASLNVAKEAGLHDIVLSTGRTSEKGVQTVLDLPVEAYAMMGDYLAFSLQEAAGTGFSHIHLAGMWAKILKAAMKIPQTHVRHGELKPEEAALHLASFSISPSLQKQLAKSNTAREMYGILEAEKRADIIHGVCLQAKAYAQSVADSRGLASGSRHYLEKCKWVVSSKRLAHLVADMGLHHIPVSPVTQAFNAMKQALTDSDVALLASGDPLFYGIGRLALQRFPAEQVLFHPALSSMQEAFARFKLYWDDAKLISLHGREATNIPALLLGQQKSFFFTDPRNTPAR